MIKVVFLDRDGVINRCAPSHEYITRVEDFVLNNGIVPLLRHLQGQGCQFIIVTNQRGIARGLMSYDDLDQVHAYMRTLLHAEDISILDIFTCVHDHDECDCRKPKDGLLRQACACHTINVAESVLISDSEEDVSMGNLFGIGKNLFVRKDHPEDALSFL